jgi:hypothetical protein
MAVAKSGDLKKTLVKAIDKKTKSMEKKPFTPY